MRHLIQQPGRPLATPCHEDSHDSDSGEGSDGEEEPDHHEESSDSDEDVEARAAARCFSCKAPPLTRLSPQLVHKSERHPEPQPRDSTAAPSFHSPPPRPVNPRAPSISPQPLPLHAPGPPLTQNPGERPANHKTRKNRKRQAARRQDPEFKAKKTEKRRQKSRAARLKKLNDASENIPIRWDMGESRIASRGLAGSRNKLLADSFEVLENPDLRQALQLRLQQVPYQ